tara:strand:- start:787 stop:2145 length:1359 start_codon:yes stop_codon:yes gene_type:complete
MHIFKQIKKNYGLLLSRKLSYHGRITTLVIILLSSALLVTTCCIDTLTLEENQVFSEQHSITQANNLISGKIERPIEKKESQPQLETFTHVVKPGENLATIFKDRKISAMTLKKISDVESLGSKLGRIFPGHQLLFAINKNGQLHTLEYRPNPMHQIKFERQGDVFLGEESHRIPEQVITYSHAIIEDSLFLASQSAGLTDELTMRLAQIFQWDIDFVLDIRAGDRFYIMYEELYIDNNFVSNGEILAAEFFNQTEHYKAVFFNNGENTTGHFTPEGESIRKAFLRAPVEFSRISSNFNLRRKHPLFKRTMPHRGIDYAAPKGTPVLASGDGIITVTAKTEANGNYIVIKHGEIIITKYLHLSRIKKGIAPGKRVSQGEVIGFVGDTGWATAPHLHYEFLVNGTHKNPRTVSLPDAKPIGVIQRQSFESSTKQLLSLLNSYKEEVDLSADAD